MKKIDCLSAEEIKEIVRQMVNIHKTNQKPNYIYDEWTKFKTRI